MKQFRIQSYTKKELALLYFPSVENPHVAVNRLMSWINRCHPLLAALNAQGYRKTAQVAIPTRSAPHHRVFRRAVKEK